MRSNCTDGAALRIFRFLPCHVVEAEGHGDMARIWRSSSTAGRVHSILPASFLRVRQWVTSAASWGCGTISPHSQRGKVSVSKSAPTWAKTGVSVPVLCCASMGTARCDNIGPESSPNSINMMVTPVLASPAPMAALMGEAPRQRGNNEA